MVVFMQSYTTGPDILRFHGLNGHGHLFFRETLKSAMDFTLRACPGSDQPRVDSGRHTTQLWSNESYFISPLRGPRTSTTHSHCKGGG